MKQSITFTNVLNWSGSDKPILASKIIPEWYKNTQSYSTGEKKPSGTGFTPSTIKRCMPVFDAMTSGYIILSPVDIYVSIKEDQQWFEWPALEPISFHPIEQAPEHPYKKPYSYPKWMNPWAIKTPKGYSTLFVQPFHRDSVFTILPGVVDTDAYTAPVNFPFVINDPNFEGMIPKGTPIAQVIPFKREKWNMKMGIDKDRLEQDGISHQLRSKFFDRYKQMFWSKKEYQ